MASQRFERRPGSSGAQEDDPICFLLPPLGHGQGESKGAYTIVPGHIPNPLLWDTKEKAKERRENNKKKAKDKQINIQGSTQQQNHSVQVNTTMIKGT